MRRVGKGMRKWKKTERERKLGKEDSSVLFIY